MFSRTTGVVIYGVLGGLAGGVIYLPVVRLLVLQRKRQGKSDPENVVGLAFTITVAVVVTSTLLLNRAEVIAKLR